MATDREPRHDEVRLNDGVSEYIGLRTAIICGLIMADVSKERRNDLFNGAHITADELSVLRKRGVIKQLRANKSNPGDRVPRVSGGKLPSNLDETGAKKALEQQIAAIVTSYKGLRGVRAVDAAEGASMMNPALNTLWRKANPGKAFGLIDELEDRINAVLAK